MIRVSLYLVLRILGIEFWVLPEIFDNDALFPLTSFSFAKDGIWGWVFRLSSNFFWNFRKLNL